MRFLADTNQDAGLPPDAPLLKWQSINRAAPRWFKAFRGIPGDNHLYGIKSPNVSPTARSLLALYRW